MKFAILLLSAVLSAQPTTTHVQWITRRIECSSDKAPTCSETVKTMTGKGWKLRKKINKPDGTSVLEFRLKCKPGACGVAGAEWVATKDQQ